MNINLHIERLALEGVNVEPHQRTLLQDALQTELTRLLTSGGLSQGLAGGIVLPRISVPSIQLAEGNNPTRLGWQIAQSVYGGISHE
jgi:hypothetical protein